MKIHAIGSLSDRNAICGRATVVRAVVLGNAYSVRTSAVTCLRCRTRLRMALERASYGRGGWGALKRV